MRIAFAQGGEGVEPIDAQLARLSGLAPDRYHIEEHPAGPARRRLLEMLDGLEAGDELILSSLAVLRLDLAEVLKALVALSGRAVRVVLLTEGDEGKESALSPDCRRLLADLLAVQQAHEKAAVALPASAQPTVLTDEERADIRRLSRAGLSPRRIGLIYRRSPKCIADILSGSDPSAAGPLERRRA